MSEENIGAPGAFFLEDDLQQDAARQVFVGLGVDDLELDLLEHQFLDVGQRDVAAGRGVVETAVRVLLDDSRPVRHRRGPLG